jgi:hypothetical protein
METLMDQEIMKNSFAGFSSLHTCELLMEARLGIPQGSGCSPIVGMYIVSQLAWPSMPAVLLNYADNFLLLALDSLVLDKAVEELTGAVSGLPGGKFNLALKAKSNASKGFEFLGHHLRVVEGVLKTEPTDVNWADLTCQLNRYEEKVGNLKLPLSELDKNKALKWAAAEYKILEGWKQAFSECDKSEMKWLDIPMDYIFHTLHNCGATFAQLAGAAEPWMGYVQKDYALAH